MVERVADRTRWKSPSNLGWLECSLSQNEIDHLWKCVDQSMKKDPQCFKNNLAGNISHSYMINDLDDYFFNNTITPLIGIYKDFFKDMIGNGRTMPVLYEDLIHFEPKLERFWVNYQKQHDFNPPHDHSGVYSFVIWLKIPIEFKDQNKNNKTNTPLRSAFSFQYLDLLGNITHHNYELGKKFEGKMLFFPSGLNHEVYPFYDCEEDRISISGNILMSIKNDAL
tara:strand:+ start:258 stop:929 length:672 start_codon:yes stop_codon:yes gene_type:complete